MTDKVKLGDRWIGEDEACFIIAEVGLNHNGDYDLAHQAIIAAAESGADAVKFQNFITEDFLTDKTLLHTYTSQGQEYTESLWEICKRSEFKREWIIPLKALCDELGVVFLSTPTSESGVLDLTSNGVQALKNGSDYITHLPLLKFMGSTGVPVIISTGMADEEDIDNAISAVREGGPSEAIILHCISNYPTAAVDVNLNRMVSLKNRFNVPVGFSDHTEGWVAAAQAVTLGACVIEKHFTLDKDLPGPDHWFSSSPQELKTLVTEVRNAELRLGKGDIVFAESEMVTKDEWRVGLVASMDIKAGEILTSDKVAIRKPGQGLLPIDLEHSLGKRMTQALKEGDPIHPHHLE